MTATFTELSLQLGMAAEYVLGLPMFAAVTLANHTEGAEYYDLIDCDPLSPPFPVEFSFRAGSQLCVLPARSTMAGEATRRGFDLTPGEARTFVLDLSELEPELSPGTWQCEARWAMRRERPRSEPVAVTLVPGALEDVRLARYLRTAGGTRTASWLELIRSPHALELPESVGGLSAEASRALLPYLLLHQVVHGPDPLHVFPLEPFDAQRQGPWASEAALFGYELRWARKAGDADQRRQELLSRWPGSAYRVAQIEAGAGLLSSLRRRYGAESEAR